MIKPDDYIYSIGANLTLVKHKCLSVTARGDNQCDLISIECCSYYGNPIYEFNTWTYSSPCIVDVTNITHETEGYFTTLADACAALVTVKESHIASCKKAITNIVSFLEKNKEK